MGGQSRARHKIGRRTTSLNPLVHPDEHAGGVTLHHGDRRRIHCHPVLAKYFAAAIIVQCLMQFFGAWIMQALEEPHERQLLSDQGIAYDELEAEFCTANGIGQTECSTTMSSWNDAVGGLPGSSGPWDFWHSFQFVTSTTTTVGWGKMAPLTNEGRIFAVVLGTVGIPVTLVTFTLIGVYLKRLVHFSLFHVGKLFIKNIRDSALNVATVFVSVVICWVYIFAIAAYYDSAALNGNKAVFETYYEAVYFCAISFTTIGYGDFLVEPQNPNAPDDGVATGVHSIFFTISLFVGISLYSMLLAVIQHLIETKQLQAAEHLDDAGDELAAGIIVHDHHDEDDNGDPRRAQTFSASL